MRRVLAPFVAAGALALGMTVAPPAQASGFHGLTGTNTEGLAYFPTAKIARYYWPGLPTAVLPIGGGRQLILSFKTVPSDAFLGTVLDSWCASGRRIYWTWHHEPDPEIPPAVYVATTNHLIDVASHHSCKTLTEISVLVGYQIRTRGPAYYVPRIKVLGFDPYSLSDQAADIAWSAKFAPQKKIIFPETGDGIGPTEQTDAASLAYAKAFWAALPANCVAALWFSLYNNTLADKPMTTAFLARQ